MNWLFRNGPLRPHRPAAAPETCDSIEPLLSLYADGMASAAEVRRLEAHLPGCSDCRESLSWLRATHQTLAARPLVPPPADLHARIAAAIAASSAAPLTLPVRFRLRPAAGRSAYAAAASLTALGLIFGYNQISKPHPAGQPPQPALQAKNAPRPTQMAALPHKRPAVSVRPASRPFTARPLVVASAAPARKPLSSAAHVSIKAATLVPPKSEGVIASAVLPPRRALPGLQAPVRVHPAPGHAAAQRPVIASVRHVPAEHKLPAVIAPDTRAPKADPTTMEAKAMPPAAVPVNIGPATVTTPVVQTASARSESSDLLGTVKAHAEEMRTAAYARIKVPRAEQASFVIVPIDYSPTK